MKMTCVKKRELQMFKLVKTINGSSVFQFVVFKLYHEIIQASHSTCISDTRNDDFGGCELFQSLEIQIELLKEVTLRSKSNELNSDQSYDKSKKSNKWFKSKCNKQIDEEKHMLLSRQCCLPVCKLPGKNYFFNISQTEFCCILAYVEHFAMSAM